MARILLADDNELIRETLKDLLESEGHSVVEVGNGNDAVAALQTQDIEILITDMFMPGMDGIELIRHVRTQSVDVKVVAISGGGAFQTANYATNLASRFGADFVLHKPFDNDVLIEHISTLAA